MPPLLDNKNPSSPSVFAPSALLREARRQKGRPDERAPDLRPRSGRRHRAAAPARGARAPVRDWPCYHTEIDVFELAGESVGIIGRAVGAPFAVLIAEELFASGCRFLISITSAGQIVPAGTRLILW